MPARILVVVACLVALISVGGSASADPFPNTGMVLADNSEHTWRFPGGAGAVPAGNRYRYDQAMANLDLQTHLWITAVACNANTDVQFREIDLTGNIRGEYHCLTLTGGRCHQSREDVDVVQVFNESLWVYPGGGTPFADNFEVNMVKTARHELGHSIGLNNDGLSFSDANGLFLGGFGDVRGCTVSGLVPTELVWMTYSAHHVPEINAAY